MREGAGGVTVEMSDTLYEMKNINYYFINKMLGWTILARSTGNFGVQSTLLWYAFYQVVT